MADGYGVAMAAGARHRAGQLAADRGRRPVVVEKDIAHHGRNTEFPRQTVAGGPPRGQAVEELQIPRPQRHHDPAHIPGRCGKTAAHVVVDAHITVQPVQIDSDAAVQFAFRQAPSAGHWGRGRRRPPAAPWTGATSLRARPCARGPPGRRDYCHRAEWPGLWAGAGQWPAQPAARSDCESPHPAFVSTYPGPAAYSFAIYFAIHVP